MSGGCSSGGLKESCNKTLYKGKGDKGNCKNYRENNLSIAGKIYAYTLAESVLNDWEQIVDEQGALKSGWGWVDKIFTPKQKYEKIWKEKLIILAYVPSTGIWLRLIRKLCDRW